MKRISKYLMLVVILSLIFAGKTFASSFPGSIKPSLNTDYLNSGGWCVLGTNGRYLCAKEYASTDSSASGKAFCTSFKKSVPIGVTCSPTVWSSNKEMNNRVAAMLGAVMTYSRSSKEGMSWNNYYYTELAINRLLYFGYTGKLGYGSQYNDISSLSSGYQTDKYYKLLSIADYTYKNYNKTKVEITSKKYDSSTKKATALVTCRNYAGKKISCNIGINDTKITSSINGSAVTGTKIFNKNSDGTVTIGTDLSRHITDSTEGTLSIDFSATDTQHWYAAQNYSCGENYQSLTPNYLLDKYTTKSATANLQKKFEINKKYYSLEISKVDTNTNELIDGAIINIKKDGSIISSNVSVTNGALFIPELEAGTYCVEEVSAPTGYTWIQGEYCTTINDTNESGEIVIKNQKQEKKNNLTINKVDEKGNPVKGAKIKVYYYDLNSISSVDDETDISASTKAIAEFTTDGTAKVVEGLEVGKTYTVIEEEIPEGYAGGISAIEITISEDNSKNVVTLTNTHSSIKISKQSVTSTKELPGAKLTITDAQGNAVASWTSTDKPQEIEGLSDGDYTLTETTAPQGYTVAESIKFTIENGVVKGDDDNTVVMKDATIVDVPDTFNIQNVIAMIAGVVLVGLGTGVLFYETKKKKA